MWLLLAVAFLAPLGWWALAVRAATADLAELLSSLPGRGLNRSQFIVAPEDSASRELVDLLCGLPEETLVWEFPAAAPPEAPAWRQLEDYLHRHQALLETAKGLLDHAGGLGGDRCVGERIPSAIRDIRTFAGLLAVEQEAQRRRGAMTEAWASWFRARKLITFADRLPCGARAGTHIRWKSEMQLQHLVDGATLDPESMRQVRAALGAEVLQTDASFRKAILLNAFHADRAAQQHWEPWTRARMRVSRLTGHRTALGFLGLPPAQRVDAFVAWQRDGLGWEGCEGTDLCDPLDFCVGYAYEGIVLARSLHQLAGCAMEMLARHAANGAFPTRAPAACSRDERGKPVDFSVTDRGFRLQLGGGWDWPDVVRWEYRVP